MHTQTPLFCLFLLLFFIFGCTAQENGCTYVETNKTYQVGETWTVPGQCIKYACMQYPVLGMDSISLPAIVKYVCTDPKPPDNDMRNCHPRVPYPNDPYPKCCTHLICNRPGYQEIIKPKY